MEGPRFGSDELRALDMVYKDEGPVLDAEGGSALDEVHKRGRFLT